MKKEYDAKTRQQKLERKQEALENAIQIVNAKIKTTEDLQQKAITDLCIEPNKVNDERVNKLGRASERLYEELETLKYELKGVKSQIRNLEFELINETIDDMQK